MKKIRSLFILFISTLALNSCSKEDIAPSCPLTQNISMKINGELKQFEIDTYGIVSDKDGSGSTLVLWLFNGTQNLPIGYSNYISLHLPYKKKGKNIFKVFSYSQREGSSSLGGVFELGELQSKVTANKNTCFSATFSGTKLIDGTEITITDGIIDIIYNHPLEE